MKETRVKLHIYLDGEYTEEQALEMIEKALATLPVENSYQPYEVVVEEWED